MKFGVIMHKTTQNIGDDIQTFAAMQHLPHTDYFLDRECLDKFVTEDGKPVAVVMSAWYMWKKWNWPPSDYIVPLLVGMHYSDHQKSEQNASPVKYQFMTGCGKEYMNAHGPVGCRDRGTADNFKKLGINSYVSGCITLTLPKMEIRKPEREYICACDLPDKVLAKLKELTAGSGIDIIETHHYKDYRGSNATWEERERAVVELLTLYQNAKCVVTRRLHCALPCLAMEVPVFVVNKHDAPKSGRFDPYYNWLRHCTFDEFAAGRFDYDFLDPPENSREYLKYREGITKAIADFVEKYKDDEGSPEDHVLTDYSAEELTRWRADTMREVMNEWFGVTVQEEKQIKILKKKLKKFRSDEEYIAKIEEENKRLKKENQHLNNVMSCRSVRMAVKIRNAFAGEKKKIKL